MISSCASIAFLPRFGRPRVDHCSVLDPRCECAKQQLIEAVFAELEEREPEGFPYKALRLEGGASFLHVVIEHDVDEPDSLQAVPAFQRFVANIADRCDLPPVAAGATVVGGFG
jgi:hypothetical protein